MHQKILGVLSEWMGLPSYITKYLCRFPHKHVGEGGLDDLRKARWFIEKQIEEILKEEDIK